MAKRTKAQRRAAAKKAWEARRAREAGVAASADPAVPVADRFVPPGYESLERELAYAFNQSANGKGKERHANGRPFDRQPILELARLYGPGFTAGQSAKKTQEALGMAARGEFERAIAEVHGAIVYLAATALRLREQASGEQVKG